MRSLNLNLPVLPNLNPTSSKTSAVVVMQPRSAAKILLQEFQSKLRVVDELIGKLGFALREVKDDL